MANSVGFAGNISNPSDTNSGKRVSRIIKLGNDEFEDSDSSEESEEDFFDRERIKKKFLSAWNNMKYGSTGQCLLEQYKTSSDSMFGAVCLDVYYLQSNITMSSFKENFEGFNVSYKPSFNDQLPIWLLGRCYHGKSLELAADDREIQDRHKILSTDQFFEDFSSLLWLTYRRKFSQLAKSNITSDGGWGCMLRSGQMLLANSILIHMLREGWRTSQRATSYEKNYIYRMIIRFFNDEDSDYSPFSLHELVRLGEECGKKPGDWYGPNSVAHTISKAVNCTSHPALETFRVYVAQDCTVYQEDVIELCTKCKNCYNPSCQKKFWRSVLLLVPVRLGSEALNQIYIPCLQDLLVLDYCVGIIGGRPKHSLYFVGFQDQNLIHLDPHYLQDKVDMSTGDFPVESFHCQYPKKMSFNRMDPSCAIGFYCRTREDFDSFCKQAADILFPPFQNVEYPMFIFDEGSNPSPTDFTDGLHHVQNTDFQYTTTDVSATTIPSVPSPATASKSSKQKKHKKKHKKKEQKDGKASPVEDFVLVD